MNFTLSGKKYVILDNNFDKKRKISDFADIEKKIIRYFRYKN